MKKNSPDVLISDITKMVENDIGGRSFTIWEPPSHKDNITWFTKKANEKGLELKFAFRNDELLAERIESLVKKGADITAKVYDIAEVNRPLFLTKALELGANPNLPNSEGRLAIDRAIAQSRLTIAKIIIDSPNFEFGTNAPNYANLLFLTVYTRKFNLANQIANKKPSLILEKNKNNLSILYEISEILNIDDHLKNDSNIKQNVFHLVEKCIDYADSQNYEFQINEKDDKGVTLMENSMEIASLIKQKYAERLSKELTEKNNNNKNKFKI